MYSGWRIRSEASSLGAERSKTYVVVQTIWVGWRTTCDFRCNLPTQTAHTSEQRVWDGIHQRNKSSRRDILAGSLQHAFRYQRMVIANLNFGSREVQRELGYKRNEWSDSADDSWHVIQKLPSCVHT